MITPEAKLKDNIFDSPEQAHTRDGFGKGLVEVADSDERIVALCADLTESTRMEPFAKKYPSRFIEVGVAEQNLAALASGFAAFGKIPFITSYATFSPGGTTNKYARRFQSIMFR
jgi:transketolase